MNENFNCAFCGNTAEQNGWVDLCNRKCFYGLNDLLCDFSSQILPDERCIKYFTKHPTSEHSFNSEKIYKFIKGLSIPVSPTKAGEQETVAQKVENH